MKACICLRQLRLEGWLVDRLAPGSGWEARSSKGRKGQFSADSRRDGLGKTQTCRGHVGLMDWSKRHDLCLRCVPDSQRGCRPGSDRGANVVPTENWATQENGKAQDDWTESKLVVSVLCNIADRRSYELWSARPLCSSVQEFCRSFFPLPSQPS